MRNIKAATFSAEHAQRKRRKELSDASAAAIVFGTALTLVSLVRSFVSVGVLETAGIGAAICGVAAVLLGTFFPQLLLPVFQKLRSAFNRLGVWILRMILIPVYLLTCACTFLFLRRRKDDYSFESWRDLPPKKNSFFEKPGQTSLNEGKRFLVIGRVFAGISAHKAYFLVPLILLLLLIGLLFFFVSSSTVFSFIYTFV